MLYVLYGWVGGWVGGKRKVRIRTALDLFGEVRQAGGVVQVEMGDEDEVDLTRVGPGVEEREGVVPLLKWRRTWVGGWMDQRMDGMGKGRKP